ncbi:ATP-binding protein [Acaryochloris sp. 'Moss Beach']|uniref:AAA family ATPase n=1 Tax=Acaryochloris sp. 'Moss Beach' TaxID=2740837 RepID=UPI001F23EC1A|nr:ATP-binding protein [Acaryochloris sp. 'Moss Beach']UJB69951.1 ATP-binding protein [Acaryochloris sp. 'Moss Beach']
MSIKVNPGGILAPSEVVGRDRLIKKLWRILNRQSLVLTAERRMGKTSIIKKMNSEAPEAVITIYRDLEGIKTAVGFAKKVLEDVEAYLSGLQKSAVRVRALLKNLTGTEIAGVKLPAIPEAHWNDVLQRTMEDLLEHQDCPVIFFWDELPLMLYDIKQQQGESVAQGILDVLRSLRQTHSNLRMVFTGSIGLHNVLTTLKRAGYANDPTNDMKIVDVPPLEKADAEDLAQQLIVGEGLTVEQESTAQEIAKAADNLPFFIHHLVDHLVFEEGESVDIPSIVKQYMLDPQDPWHLRYYRERIDTYYLNEDKALALALLDALALASEPLSFDEIYNRVLSQTDAFDAESTRAVLTLTA